MLKTCGILLLVLTCLLIGNRSAAIEREREGLWEQMARLSLRLSDRLLYTAQPIPPLLKELCRSETFPALRFLPEVIAAPPENWKNVWQKSVEVLPLKPECRQLLVGFVGPLGLTEVAGQTEHCRQYAKRFEEMRQAASRDAAEKGRLYPVLGLLCGLALALLLV
ncbi:MAG: hypothetical protein IJE00_03975 [Clostridia bacterium]|nr:hypothetical protein [Clostridia bacterium]